MPADRSALGSAVHAAIVDGPHAPTADVIAEAVRRRAPLLDEVGVADVVAEVLARIDGLGPLRGLLADRAVTEVLVNAGGRAVWFERDGVLQRSMITLDGPAVEHLVERIVGPLGLRVDRSRPAVAARLSDGSRVHIVVPPVAVDGTCIAIRRFGRRDLTLQDFCAAPPAHILAAAVADRANIVVVGATGSGKTTLLNALAALVPHHERMITLEDAAELHFAHPHVVRLETRPPGDGGVGEITMQELLRNALRLRPDRIVVGEVRGPEALDMIQAMSTGHDGSLATFHANGPVDALLRLELLASSGGTVLDPSVIRRQIDAVVDLVVHVRRCVDGRREVAGIWRPSTPAERASGASLLVDATEAVVSS